MEKVLRLHPIAVAVPRCASNARGVWTSPDGEGDGQPQAAHSKFKSKRLLRPLFCHRWTRVIVNGSYYLLPPLRHSGTTFCGRSFQRSLWRFAAVSEGPPYLPVPVVFLHHFSAARYQSGGGSEWFTFFAMPCLISFLNWYGRRSAAATICFCCTHHLPTITTIKVGVRYMIRLGGPYRCLDELGAAALLDDALSQSLAVALVVLFCSDFMYTETLVHWLEKTLKMICMCMCVSLIDKDNLLLVGWPRTECQAYRDSSISFCVNVRQLSNAPTAVAHPADFELLCIL